MYSRKGQTNSHFANLRDAGRLDLVHECVVAALFLSHGLRRNVVFNTLLNGPPAPPLHLKVDGRTLYDVRTDQETWADIFRRVLSGRDHPGVSVQKMGFEVLLKDRAKHARIYVLEEGGEDVETVGLEGSVFVLGDHIGLPKTVENFALRYGEKVSLGSQPYLAASCITILNFLMDKRSIV